MNFSTCKSVAVTAHAYTAAAIKRAVECGVRSIEHGNCLDEAAAGAAGGGRGSSTQQGVSGGGARHATLPPGSAQGVGSSHHRCHARM